MRRSFTFALLLAVLLLLAASPLAAQETPLAPLSERGPYHVGQQRLEFVDESRDSVSVPVILWYPAIVPPDKQDQASRAEASHTPLGDLAPDLSGGPYPLVLYSHEYRGSPVEFRSVLEPLVSQGYVVASIIHDNSASAHTIVDQPLDALFVLDQLAALNNDPASDLQGLINTDQTGVVGMGTGMITTTALSGARIDPQFIGAVLEPVFGDALRSIYSDWDWEALQAYHDALIPSEPGSLWASTTDPRIQAVVSYMPCGTYWFGYGTGLSLATLPTLVFGATDDPYCAYADETVNLDLNLGSNEHYLVSLLDATHQKPNTSSQIDLATQQLVSAFLGAQLQGKTEYAEYLTEDYAESLDNVIWGIDQRSMVHPFNPFAITWIDGGTVAVGDRVEGEIAQPADRLTYTLELNTDSILNLYVNATGRRTNDASGMPFDPNIEVLDAEGKSLFGNEEFSFADDMNGNYNAGLEAIALPAGTYTLRIGSWMDYSSGPFELIVEPAP